MRSAPIAGSPAPTETHLANPLDNLVSGLLKSHRQRITHLRSADVVSGMTYAEAYEHIQILKSRLASAGLQTGGRVGIHGQNCCEWIIADLALLDLDCVSVAIPVDDASEGSDFSRLCTVHNLSGLISIRPSPMPHADNEPERQSTSSGQWSIEIYVCPHPPRAAELDSDIFTVSLSSGTTGMPKGIAISKAGAANAIRVFEAVWAVNNRDNILIILPFTSFQQRFFVYLAIKNGFAITIAPYSLMYNAFKSTKPTINLGPPSFFELLPRQIALTQANKSIRYRAAKTLYKNVPEPLTRRLRFWLGKKWTRVYGDRIKFLMTGSAPVTRELLDEFWALGLPLYEIYGSTEIGWITFNSPSQTRLGTAGRPAPGICAELTDDGELLIRSQAPLAGGYLTAPGGAQVPLTSRDDRYVATGDIGAIADGFITVIGRKDSVIVTPNGQKVNPEALQREIEQDPRVSKAFIGPISDGGILACLAWVNDSITDHVYVQNRVNELNLTLPSSCRIERVHTMPARELDSASGLITRTYKIDRTAARSKLLSLVDKARNEN